MRNNHLIFTAISFTVFSFVYLFTSQKIKNKYNYMYYLKEEDRLYIQRTCGDDNLKNNTDVYLIPRDKVIDTLSDDEVAVVYWKYANTIQVLCHNQMRFGNVGDGGKEICLDELYKPKQPCLVYSFGSSFKFDFEEAVIRHIKCEIHTFDPSKPIQGRTIPSGINFHLVGLASKNSINSKGWEMKTLSTLKKILNHTERVIDILKIDIESEEWSALPEMLESGVLEKVKQLSIEIHYNKAEGKQQIKILRTLYEAGFRIFMHEHNPTGTRPLREPYLIMANLNEISLINIKSNIR